MTVGMGTALGVASLLASIYCICTCRRRGNKSDAASIAPSRAAQSPATTVLETLVIEACYPELQLLDALSRSVRQKKQNVHDEIIKIYGAAAAVAKSNEPTTTAVGNVYSSESRPSVKQIKRHRQQLQHDRATSQNVTSVAIDQPELRERSKDSFCWEIGQHQILSPTSV